MKTILKPLSIIILIMALAGCAAQKSGNNPGKSTAEEVLYTQALKALEERNFIIKIDEFHFPSDKAPCEFHEQLCIHARQSRRYPDVTGFSIPDSLEPEYGKR